MATMTVHLMRVDEGTLEWLFNALASRFGGDTELLDEDAILRLVMRRAQETGRQDNACTGNT